MSTGILEYKHEVHLNINVRGLPLSPTLAINEISNRLLGEGKKIFKLGLGQSPFPVPEPVVQALRDNAGQKDYLPVRGLESLRQAITGYFARKQHLQYDPRNILVGPGSKELMFLLQLVYYGELVIPLPSWVSYAPQAHIVGRPVQWVKTRQEDGWIITPDELERLCRTDPTKPRILVLNYPNNPTGKSYSDQMLQDIASIAKKYHAIILSDEIYGELTFSRPHISIARYYPEGTIISSGLSKWCGAGGWRLGICIFPEELSWLLNSMASVASETFTSTSAPIQYAAITAFNGGKWLDHYLLLCRKILGGLAKYVHTRLRHCGLRVRRAEGGFYLFPDFTPLRKRLRAQSIYSSNVLCQRLLEDTGVALLPGSAFGMPEEKLLARLAFVDFDGDAALEAAERLPLTNSPTDDFLETYCPQVTMATQRLCDWLQS